MSLGPKSAPTIFSTVFETALFHKFITTHMIDMFDNASIQQRFISSPVNALTIDVNFMATDARKLAVHPQSPICH